MIGFSISRRVINIGLAFVHPQWRLITFATILSIVNVVVGELNVLATRSNLAGLAYQEYLQYPDTDYGTLACAYFWVGMLPLLLVILPTSLTSLGRPQLDKRVDQALRSLGLKGQVYSGTTMLYQGTIGDRQITVFVNAQRPQRGVYMTPQPKSVTFNPSITILMSAQHRGELGLLPETTQVTGLPPGVIKKPLDRSIIPGRIMLTLDEDWSNKLLANEDVVTALRHLTPEGDPNRHQSIEIGGRLITLRTMFTSSKQTIDPLVQFVTVENIQGILGDLRVVAEAAEGLPEPAKPGPDDNLVRAASADPNAVSQMLKMAILVILSLGWLWVNSSALRGQ